MPIVTIKVLEGVFDRAQQEAMIDAVTDAMCKVGGGQKLRTDEILARRAKRKT